MDTKASLRLLHTQLGNLIEEYQPSDDYFDDFIGRSRVIGKAKEIQHALTDPKDMPFQLTAQIAEISVLQLVGEIDFFKHFPSSGYVTFSSLAESSGIQPALLARILRMLTATGYTSQSPADTEQFSRTYLSRGLEEARDWFTFMYLLLMLRGKFAKFFVDSNIPGYKPLTEPTDSRYCPMTYDMDVLGTPVWEVFYKNTDMVSTALKAFQSIETANTIIGCYDFGALAKSIDNQDRLMLVDVGGGQGQSIIQILDANPQIDPKKFMLQDLQGPIAASVQSKILPDSTAKVVHDFFTPQPDAAKGAKAYLLRRVLHDWPDNTCIEILKQIANAMSQDSVVLIADVVLPDRVEQKDLPLVANDWIVLAITGKERTAKDFMGLFNAAGLELVEIHRQNSECGASTIVEGRLKR